MITVPILVIATAVAVLWSLFKYQTTYIALLDLLPPQFQDGLNSKFAFPEYVLSPSTPLTLQAEYVKSQIGFCLATLGVSLLCFSFEKTIVGLIVMIIFFAFSALTIKTWKGPVAELVGIRVGVVSGVMNLESSGVEASDWRPRHEQVYHDA